MSIVPGRKASLVVIEIKTVVASNGWKLTGTESTRGLPVMVKLFQIFTVLMVVQCFSFTICKTQDKRGTGLLGLR